MMKIFVVLSFLFLMTAAGCSSGERSVSKMEKSSLLLDVRSVEEFQSGALKGAVNLPHLRVAEGISAIAPDKDTPIYIYCRSGRRVQIAMETLKKMGYTRLIDLGGLENAREKLDLPVVTPR